MTERRSHSPARSIFPLESAWEAGTSWIPEMDDPAEHDGSRLQRRRERDRRHQDRMRSILRAVPTAAAVMALVFLVFVLYGLADNRWYKIITIDGGSMAPTIMSGDAIVLARPPQKVEAGMVLTLMVDGQLVTHRVVEVRPDGGFVTCGDANEARDDWSSNTVTVVGRYVMRLPGLGRLLTLGRIGSRGPGASGAFLHKRSAVSGAVTCNVPAIDPSATPLGAESVSGGNQSAVPPTPGELPEDIPAKGVNVLDDGTAAEGAAAAEGGTAAEGAAAAEGGTAAGQGPTANTTEPELTPPEVTQSGPSAGD